MNEWNQKLGKSENPGSPAKLLMAGKSKALSQFCELNLINVL